MLFSSVSFRISALIWDWTRLLSITVLLSTAAEIADERRAGLIGVAALVAKMAHQ